MLTYHDISVLTYSEISVFTNPQISVLTAFAVSLLCSVLVKGTLYSTWCSFWDSVLIHGTPYSSTLHRARIPTGMAARRVKEMNEGRYQDDGYNVFIAALVGYSFSVLL